MLFLTVRNSLLKVAILFMGVFAMPSDATLNIGDAAPDFTAQASLNGKAFTFSLKDALKKGSVVVYFYPSAYTPGCNIQAHEFAVNMDKFSGAHATVIGVSLDSIARLNEFSADPDYCGGKVPVASDVDGKIAKAYGLKSEPAKAGSKDTRGKTIDHAYLERVSFVVDSSGKIKAVIGGVPAKDNVSQALKVVQELTAAKPSSAH